METIKLNDERKKEYQDLIGAAQNVELAIGGATHKIFKMQKVREQIDADIKTWWDNVSDELNVDKSKDYFVTQDGEISVVEKPAGGAPNVGATPNEQNTQAQSPVGPEGTNQEVKASEVTASQTEDVDAKPAVDNKEGATAESLT